jgi:ERCC4-type nuclease
MLKFGMCWPVLKVDIHEPDIIKTIMSSRTSIVVQHLKSGDYAFGNFGIERKTLSDFASSLKSKRLLNQLYRLKRTYARAILLLEIADLRHLHWSPYLFRVILYINFSMGMTIFYTYSPEHTADVICMLYKKLKGPTG